jgi:probable biosynthetic protein (TIGR04098 family)
MLRVVGAPGSDMRTWDSFQFTIGMPHMVPDKLSEVELLKLLGAWQWDSIARVLGCRSSGIANGDGERLYASFINVELNLPPPHGQDSFVEGDAVAGANTIAVFANKFVEGLLVFGHEAVPADVTARVKSRGDLVRLECPWAYMTNAFVARMGSNSKLKVFEPAGLASRPAERMETLPTGIAEHQSVQATGAIADFGDGHGVPIVAQRSDPIVYPIMPESDVNGAGLLYFARYVAIMNYGERVFLSDRLERSVSSPLLSCLATERRRLYYFMNADPTDSVRISVSASLVPPGPDAAPAPRRTLLKLLFRIDLYRGSDRVLMASSLVRKALNVPAVEKGLIAEGERLLATLRLR